MAFLVDAVCTIVVLSLFTDVVSVPADMLRLVSCGTPDWFSCWHAGLLSMGVCEPEANFPASRVAVDGVDTAAEVGIVVGGVVGAAGLMPAAIAVLAMDTSGCTNGGVVFTSAVSSLSLPSWSSSDASTLVPGMVAKVALTRSVSAVALSAISCVRCTMRFARDSAWTLPSPWKLRGRVSRPRSALALRGRAPVPSPAIGPWCILETLLNDARRPLCRVRCGAAGGWGCNAVAVACVSFHDGVMGCP